MDAPEGLALVCCNYPALLYHIIISYVVGSELSGSVCVTQVCSCFICVQGRIGHVDLEV